ncbi:Permease of the drug/metabolite transporter (DMT) superfamily [Microbacterium esteraromaticum]|uniref:Permease of the drug/metabolite transporter (DMT) superfamily n=1 Tax=Microbacterium esteraromaticum TaxID=57043 RepID=A0A1R4I8B3_9MICO|nr:DMT family transporter [Microbacterium esteraromaticum]SJN15936.1 Permease of the drug/metabolite transporter (DMT) superfamily [Microbacterium esteraromaticum]
MNTQYAGFTKRGWILFAIMALVWGITYLFIKEAVDSFSPPAVVSARTLLGGLVLLPFAIRAGALKAAWKCWPWVLAFGLVEMAGPFLLLSHAETQLPSGLTGLLVATVPLFAVLIALFRGDRTVLAPVRLGGLLLGFAGVTVVVAGPGLFPHGPDSAFAIGEILLTALLYAIAPFIIAHKLNDVPSIGTITLALFAIGLGYLPVALLTQHEVPTVRSTVSLLLLGIVCTAIAFVAFFALIREVGPVRAPLFTYVNPIVAIVLGAALLSEPITPGLLIGMPIVLVGCWFAATGGRLRPRASEAAPPL